MPCGLLHQQFVRPASSADRNDRLDRRRQQVQAPTAKGPKLGCSGPLINTQHPFVLQIETYATQPRLRANAKQLQGTQSTCSRRPVLPLTNINADRAVDGLWIQHRHRIEEAEKSRASYSIWKPISARFHASRSRYAARLAVHSVLSALRFGYKKPRRVLLPRAGRLSLMTYPAEPGINGETSTRIRMSVCDEFGSAGTIK